MAINRNDIRRWILTAKRQKMQFIISVCDTFDYDDYPVFCKDLEAVTMEIPKFDGVSMQTINEIIMIEGEKVTHGLTPSHIQELLFTHKQTKMEKKDKRTVFLGGTCANSTWRDQLIPMLTIGYFNPLVKNVTEEHQREEEKQREECDVILYVATPVSRGLYPATQAVQDSNKRPNKVVFSYLPSEAGREFSQYERDTLDYIGEIIKANGGTFVPFEELPTAITQVNKLATS